MTPTRSQLLALSEKATPGEWTHSVEDHDIGRGMVTRRSVVVGGDGENIIRLGYPSVDCEFIAACVNAIRAQLSGEAGEASPERELLHTGQWVREEGATFLMVELRPGADLSCRATRDAAINSAIAALPAQPNEETK